MNISAQKRRHPIRTALSGVAAAAAIGIVLSTISSPLAASAKSYPTVQVSTAAALVKALAGAVPGETISLADGTYKGKFVATASGSSGHPITVTGSRNAVLTTGSLTSGYGLHITGDYYKISGLTVTTASKGIVLDGSVGTVIDKVDVGHIGDEAVHFRAGSSNGALTNSVIHDTGLDSPGYGEGVYLGSASSNWSSVMGSSKKPDPSNNIRVVGNTISNTAAEGIDIKEGTSGGVIESNVFTRAGYSGENSADSWIDVKGNGYTISGNSGSDSVTDAFQVHKAVSGWGNNNVFSDNGPVSDVPGYVVWVQSGITGTVVTCGTTSAKKGLTNVSCSN